MSDDSGKQADKPIPDDVADRYKTWERLWTQSMIGHYWLGVASVMASSIAVVAGTSSPLIAQICAALAAVFTSMMGFLKPEQRYFKFVKAWRLLDAAVMKYRAGLINRGDLIAAVQEGETLITRMEEEKMPPKNNDKAKPNQLP